jgi:uncharacterized membrane protein YdjX (TVP38/TMEM64 family)
MKIRALRAIAGSRADWRFRDSGSPRIVMSWVAHLETRLETRDPPSAALLRPRLGPLWLFAIAWTTIPLLTGAYLVVRLGYFAQAIVAYGSAGIVLWTLFMAISVGVGLLPVYANSILCGWLFGWLPGLSSAMVSYTLASGIGSFISRRLFGSRVEAFITAHPQARAIREALFRSDGKRALLIVTLVRLAGTPFPATTLALSTCGTPRPAFFLGTFLGLLPGVTISTLMASTAASTGARNLPDVIRRSTHPALLIVGLLGALGVFALISRMARRALQRVAKPSVD